MPLSPALYELGLWEEWGITAGSPLWEEQATELTRVGNRTGVNQLQLGLKGEVHTA